MGGVAAGHRRPRQRRPHGRRRRLPLHCPHHQPGSLFCVKGYDCKLREGGRLADISPTMLEILGIPQPEEMDGVSLIVKP